MTSSSKSNDAAETSSTGAWSPGMKPGTTTVERATTESLENRQPLPISFINALRNSNNAVDGTIAPIEAGDVESDALNSRTDSLYGTGISDASLENHDTTIHKDASKLSNSSQLTIASEDEDGSNPFTSDQDANSTVTIQSTASTRLISSEGCGHEMSRSRSIIEAPPTLDTSTPAPLRCNSHTSRRHRTIHQMESISETGIANDPCDTMVEHGDRLMEDSALEGSSTSSSRSHGQNRLTYSSIDISIPNAQNPEDIDIIASTSSSQSTPRRRAVAVGESSGSTTSGNSISSDSAQGSNRSGARRHRHGIRGDVISTRRRHDVVVESSDGIDNTGIRRRPINRGNSLSIQLDAGMASLRRWIRARRSIVDEGARGAGNTASGQSAPSVSTMHLGEDDIFALSHTGRDPRSPVLTASSTSSDPSMNVSESNSSNGFLYYRPYEVHINHDVDAEIGIYGSDDESGTRSMLLHPLVTSENSRVDGRASGQLRQRAYSEPDRARIVDFFSSIFGSRAIDGGSVVDGNVPERNDARNRQVRHRSLNSRSVVTTSPIIMEETEAFDQDITPTEDQTLSSPDVHSTTRQLNLLSDDVQLPPSPLEDSVSRLRSDHSSSNLNAELPAAGLLHSDRSQHDPSTTDTPMQSDPDREARTRWMRINRQFRCIVTSVAVVFSLLLFCILISWVLLTSTFVLSHNKPCDVPLRAYFLLVSIQLLLDVFRAEIMKWLCRWRTDSQSRIPPRVIIYNVGYLIYAMLVLRMGVQSVFISESSCSSTAPELFYASLIFVCLSLVAWATIFLGYFIPFIFVAVLLTQNGYFPNGDITSSRGVMGGRRARIGSGRIGDIIGEVFPNTYANPVPYGFVDRLRVVLLNEFPASYQRDCCICMMEYKDGEVIVATPCEHVFHKRCLQEWFQLSRTCPVCRTDVPEALGMTETTLDEGNRSVSISEYDEVRDDSITLGRVEIQQTPVHSNV